MKKFYFGTVSGTIDNEANPDCVVIYEFFSLEPGKGHAKAALQSLRQDYKEIAVTDVGPDDEPAYAFWIHCLQTGLVDYVYDETGVELTRKTVGRRPSGVPWEEISKEKAEEFFPKSDRWKNAGDGTTLLAINQSPTWIDLCAVQGETLLYLTTCHATKYPPIPKSR